MTTFDIGHWSRIGYEAYLCLMSGQNEHNPTDTMSYLWTDLQLEEGWVPRKEGFDDHSISWSQW